MVALSHDLSLGVLPSKITRKSLRVWDAMQGRLKGNLAIGQDGPTCCTLSGNEWLALIGLADNTLRLWDSKAGTCLHLLKGHQGRIRQCAFSADGRLALSVSEDSTLRLWDVKNGTSVQVLRGHASQVNGCALSGRRTAETPRHLVYCNSYAVIGGYFCLQKSLYNCETEISWLKDCIREIGPIAP